MAFREKRLGGLFQTMLTGFIAMFFQVFHERCPPSANVGIVVTLGRLLVDIVGCKFQMLAAKLPY